MSEDSAFIDTRECRRISRVMMFAILLGRSMDHRLFDHRRSYSSYIREAYIARGESTQVPGRGADELPVPGESGGV
ncbi:MAG: hypothetical protein H0T69_08330 [Thermoleophilaceae bacterium]|nr:hypothetical protein [Thermoleophilaceae bacterium]